MIKRREDGGKTTANGDLSGSCLRGMQGSCSEGGWQRVAIKRSKVMGRENETVRNVRHVSMVSVASHP
jgi:hypothetical protein